MIVGINLLYLIPGKSGGTETYVRNLLSALISIDKTHTYVIYMPVEVIPTFTFDSDAVRVKGVEGILSSKLSRILYEQFIFPWKVSKDNIDVLFSPGYVIPILCRCPHVVTVHDMLYKRFPNTIPIIKRFYWSIFVPLSIKRSSYVIAVSEFVKKEFEEYYPQYKNKYVVSSESVNTEEYFVEESDSQAISKLSLPKNYILCVATLSPHKNLEVVLHAVELLKQKKHTVNVVFVGNKERSTKYLESIIENKKLNDQVYFTGYISQITLRQLYNNAEMFVMPSMYEGFGLPVLEAMACGCPVICSNAASLPEIAGSAAEYFHPQDVKTLSNKIELLWLNKTLHDEMGRRGILNVSRFNWRNTAIITNETLKKSKKN